MTLVNRLLYSFLSISALVLFSSFHGLTENPLTNTPAHSHINPVSLTTDSLPISKFNNMDTLKINLESFHKAHWSEKELQNVELIVDFVQHLMNDHDFDYIKKNFGSHPYVQHNRGIPDGMQGLIEYVSGFAQKYPDYTYDVKSIYVDGDHVIFHSQATIKKEHRGDDSKGFNIIDTWRIEDGQIVEHWDSLQPMDKSSRFFVWMSGGKVRNNNSVY